MSKCDELIEKLKQVHDDYRHRFIPINLDIKVEDLLGAFAEKDAEIAQWKEKFHDLDNQWNEQCKEIAELKAKLEDAKATAYAESVDAGMENRRLKRALWLARAERAKENAIKYGTYGPGAMSLTWSNIDSKCRAKAEEYK